MTVLVCDDTLTGEPYTLPDASTVAPAMESLDPPEWAGARWIGAADLRAVAHYTHLILQNSVGYDRARLLVRDRGSVEVDAPGGIVSRRIRGDRCCPAGRAFGLRHARGEIVACTDDDVIVEERWRGVITPKYQR